MMAFVEREETAIVHPVVHVEGLGNTTQKRRLSMFLSRFESDAFQIEVRDVTA
jgi:hypothetical protein